MEKLLLSLCIPTYKRPHLLLKAIESMIDSAADYLEQVQIVITDDSTDNTNEWVIDKVKDKIKHLKYIKNHSNLGIDGNILHAIDSSDGEFAWVLGEDDLVCQGAVKNFMSIMNKSDYAFICSNYSYVAADQRKMLKENVIGLSRDREVKQIGRAHV